MSIWLYAAAKSFVKVPISHLKDALQLLCWFLIDLLSINNMLLFVFQATVVITEPTDTFLILTGILYFSIIFYFARH
jgi:hypothetical protein